MRPLSVTLKVVYKERFYLCYLAVLRTRLWWLFLNLRTAFVELVANF